MGNSEKSMFAKGSGSYQRNNKDNEKDRKEWRRARNNDPLKFDPTSMTAYMLTSELEKIVNRAFKMIFSDYHGCVITPESAGNSKVSNVKIDLYFQPKNPNLYTEEELERRAFIPLDSLSVGPGSGIKDLIMSKTPKALKEGRHFALSEYASELLFDLTYYSEKRRLNINPFKPESYGEHVTEADNVVNNNVIRVCNIDCIDIDRVIEFIYGRKSESGANMFYLVNAQRPIAPTNPMVPSTWLISITQLPEDQLQALNAKVGNPVYSGSIRINTDM